MIPLSLFNILVAIELLLVIYSIVDVRNKYYANIMTAFVAALLGIFLAVVISIGGVQYDPAGPLISLEDSSTTDWYCVNASYDLIPVSDPSVCANQQLKVFAVNNTVQIPQCYNCEPIAVVDQGVGFIVMIFSIAMMIYSALMIYDAYLEWKMAKQEDEEL